MAKKKQSSHKKQRGARLGQHFLTGAWAARKLVESAEIQQGDVVLEIGPGKGALTKELLAAGARVIAVEKDPALASFLMSEFSESKHGKLRVTESDVRKTTPRELRLKSGAYILAANIPYYITGEILRQFLTAREQPRTMALLVQKEVAERIVARDKKESILSLSVKAYGEPSVAAVVRRGNFSPPPSVDSAILVIKNISRKFFTNVDEKKFFDVVRAGFSAKRKLLLGNLAKKYGRERAQSVFETYGVPLNARAEDVPIETWQHLVRNIV